MYHDENNNEEIFMSNKHIKWLSTQLAELTRQDVISPEAALKLRQHYEMDSLETQKSMSLFTVILATIGGLLVGGGIILIFAYNWDNIDRPMRTVLAFTPLLVSQVLCVMALYPNKRGPAWREVSGVLLFCSVAAAISIIGQTYHISGDYQGFMTTWFILLLPIVYILRPHLMTMLMIILATSNAFQFESFYWLFLFALLPYYFLVSRDKNTLKSTQTGWLWVLCCTCVTQINILFHFDLLSTTIKVITFLSFGVSLYLSGKLINTQSGFIQRPFVIIGSFTIASFLLTFTFKEALIELFTIDNMTLHTYLFLAEWHEILLIALINLSSLILILHALFKRQFINLVLPSVLVLVLIYMALFNVQTEEEIAVRAFYTSVLFSFVAFIIGCWYLYQGVKNDSTGQLNFGLLLVMGLLFIKFFNDDFTIIARGITFIILGSALIGVNVWHSRRGKS